MSRHRHHPILLFAAGSPQAQRARGVAQLVTAQQPPPLRPPPPATPATPPQILALALDLAQALCEAVVEVEPEALLRKVSRQLAALQEVPTVLRVGAAAHALLTPHMERFCALYPTTLALDEGAPPGSVTLETAAGATVRLDPSAAIESIRAVSLLPKR